MARDARVVSAGAAPSLELVLPGILIPPQSAADTVASPRFPALETVLSRARRLPAPMRAERLLCMRFGLPLEHDDDEPLAALACSAADNTAVTDWCMYLSPVHLHVDRDRVLAFAADAPALASADEASLFDAVAQYLRAEELALVRLAPGEWVVRSPRRWALATRGLIAAQGRDAAAGLPRGADAPRWIALVNDLQMLLHAHPVNQRREAAGEVALNSVWLWGAGQLPLELPPQARRIGTDLAYVRGLALLARTAAGPMPRDFAEWRANAGSNDYVLASAGASAPADAGQAQWRAALERLEAGWFEPALRALRQQRLRRLSLWLDPGREWQLGTTAARFRWRRRRPLSHYQPQTLT